MVKTVINGYSPNENVYEAIVEKMMGKSKIKGVSPVQLHDMIFDNELNIPE